MKRINIKQKQFTDIDVWRSSAAHFLNPIQFKTPSINLLVFQFS